MAFGENHQIGDSPLPKSNTYESQYVRPIPKGDKPINVVDYRVKKRNWWKILLIALAIVALIGVGIAIGIEFYNN